VEGHSKMFVTDILGHQNVSVLYFNGVKYMFT